MAKIFITGSTTGLGLGAARAMMDDGHDVVLHARNSERAGAIAGVAAKAAGVVIGDLTDRDETYRLAREVNDLGPLDAVIHNAGVGAEPSRVPNPQGHPRVLIVNVLAPYLLTVPIRPPARLIYLSSGLHTSGRDALDDIDWTTRRWSGTQAYCDSKLYVTTLALAIASRWPTVHSNAVDPGWVATRMGGHSATDDLRLGQLTQVWLATSNDATAEMTGGYWYHQRTVRPAAAASDGRFQEQLVDELGRITGEPLP